ncbi:hypothetical protein MFMK1_003633 [Metallumcola ferriviriculae]|uniref:DGQHR domain-containing protein n=1 Tax=Metallumcola ferriviriculae TaxID=3039180 RepID=A0AAU0UT06_9FIRM|nr:hypothetical protein MFMK1_003633 [Desulfitibacteraceae bacterium MK1]
MSRSKYIEFEGVFAERVLGIFRIIRGFADLRDLAEVSVPYIMINGNQPNHVVGHQRELDPKHAEDIKKYLERSDNRFIPEVILAVRYEVEPIIIETETVGVRTLEDGPIYMERRFSSKNQRIQKVRVRRSRLTDVKSSKFIRRIDGNHRLAFAERLQDDMNLQDKYLAPFCMVLLGTPENDADDYAESLIFHTINSTALPLESEHGLRLLLGQNPEYAMTPDNEFSHSPELHLTRLLADHLSGLPDPAKERFGERPLATLWDSSRQLIKMDPSIAETRQSLTVFADQLFAGLTDIATRLSANHPSMCSTYSFFELAARVWREAKGDDHEAKVSWVVGYLDRIGYWLGSQGITNLLNPLSPAQQLLETFKASQLHIPKRVFLARWYPKMDTPNDAYNKAQLRLEQLHRTLEDIQQLHGICLELIDMGTHEGGTFPIHNRMYEAISSSDIIICDLTGHRPNVYVEAGFALQHHEKNRLLFIFEPGEADDRVPFDLTTFKYIQISQAAEIPSKLKPEIEEILRSSGAGLVGGD